MMPEMFDMITEDALRNCKEVLSAKSGYGSEGDRLANFKRAGNLLKVKPTTALMGMLAKHTIALNDLMIAFEKGETPKPADVEEKITDSINYHLLLRGLLMDNAVLPYGITVYPKKPNKKKK